MSDILRTSFEWVVFYMEFADKLLPFKDGRNSGNVSGMLLYAKTDEEITPDNSYLMDGNKISVKTLDLDKDFAGIRSQLDKIVEEWQVGK